MFVKFVNCVLKVFMKKTLISSACFAIVALFPLSGYAIGVSVSPPTLSVKTAAGEEGTARFTVSNPSQEVGLFEAYPEEFEDFITLVPSRFVLEAGERREVLARVRRRETGIIRTAIAVEAETLGIPSQGIGGGVRVPFFLEILSRNNQFAANFARDSAFLPASIGALFLILLTSVWRKELFRMCRRILIL